MDGLVKKCCAEWNGNECRFSHEVAGWGCKLLTYMPEAVPTTIKERKAMFVRVYGLARSMGVLECPHYDESSIDKALENTSEIRKMLKVECPSQTDLLSDFIFDIHK